MNNKFIGTHGGNKFYPLKPKSEDVDMIGIAHSLSNICRFNGHTKFSWSVAQHSMLVEKIICEVLGYENNYRLRLLGLIHDASEAYICDIARPIKNYIGNYGKIEDEINNVILQHCGLVDVTDDELDIVKKADDIALAVEAKVLMGDTESWGLVDWLPEYNIYLHFVKPQNSLYIKGKYLMLCGDIMGMLKIQFAWDYEGWYNKAFINGSVPLIGDKIYFIDDAELEDYPTIYDENYNKIGIVDRDVFHGSKIPLIDRYVVF